MTTRRRRLPRVGGTVIACALLVGGCLAKQPPTIDRFVLEVPSVPATAERPVGILRVDRVAVSPLYDKSGFVYRTGPSRYVEDYYNQFFVAPGLLVARVAAERLGASGLFTRVLAADERGTSDWILDGEVVELYGDFREPDAPRAVLAVDYTLLMQKNPRPSVRFSKRYTAVAPAADATGQGVVDAWNRCLADVLERLERDLQDELTPTASAASPAHS